jgi:hypothetical protein
MEYATLIRGEIVVTHPALTVADLISHLQVPQVVASHATGERRSRGQGAYAESFCRCLIAPAQNVSLGETISACMLPIRSLLTRYLSFHADGGRTYVVAALFDREFIQLDVDEEMIAALRDCCNSLTIENLSGVSL